MTKSVKFLNICKEALQQLVEVERVEGDGQVRNQDKQRVSPDAEFSGGLP